MADICKAIEIEKEYISNIIHNTNTPALIDLLKDCGFNSLDKYFTAKKEYQFLNCGMKIKEINTGDGIRTIMDLLINKSPTLLFNENNETFVYRLTDEMNDEYCINNGIPVYDIYADGGTIVVKNGDLSIAIIIPDDIEINSEYILNGIKNILLKYFEHVEVNNNDIMIDNKKCIGSASINKNGMLAFVASCSFSDKTELIRNICTAPSSKIAGYIDSSILSRDRLKEELSLWLL